MPNYYDSNKATIANAKQFLLERADEQHFPSEGLYLGDLSNGSVNMPALVDINDVKGLCLLYNNEGDRPTALKQDFVAIEKFQGNPVMSELCVTVVLDVND